MTTETPSRDAVAQSSHEAIGALQAALSPHAVWWGAPHRPLDGLPSALRQRVTAHRYGPAACLTVDGLRAEDLQPLSAVTGSAFMNRPSVLMPTLGSSDLPAMLADAGFRVFFRHGADARAESRVRQHAHIGSLEFLLSAPRRLARYPVLSARAQRSETGDRERRVQAVAVLDLVQDFEVLRPLLAAAASRGSPFDLKVAVTDRVLKSQVWPAAQLFLSVMDIPWFTPLGPADVAAALGSRKSLLLTASESSAASHVFGHTACRTAPPRALRVTLQHGFECIGLRHHRAHDLDFPGGVRYASDLVLTWDDIDALPDLHPAERHKCVPVGVLKTLAEQAALLAERRWQDGVPTGPGRTPGGRARSRLLVAENLHSVRFRAPARYQRFLAFIRNAQADPGIELSIRSHPASRTLEKQRESNQLQFVDGDLTVDKLAAFDSFVSPPSTVLLDAVLTGVPAVVWTDSAYFGDAANYAALPRVTDFPQWQQQAGGALEQRRRALTDLAWAVERSTALNGVPAAWNTLVQLFG